MVVGRNVEVEASAPIEVQPWDLDGAVAGSASWLDSSGDSTTPSNPWRGCGTRAGQIDSESAASDSGADLPNQDSEEAAPWPPGEEVEAQQVAGPSGCKRDAARTTGRSAPVSQLGANGLNKIPAPPTAPGGEVAPPCGEVAVQVGRPSGSKCNAACREELLFSSPLDEERVESLRAWLSRVVELALSIEGFRLPLDDLTHEVVVYGSAATTISTQQSDVDLTVIFGSAGSEYCSAELMRMFANALSHSPECSSVVPLLGAKTPVVKFRWGDLHGDLTINNSLAVYNSMLLRSYVNIDGSTRGLCRLVKRWAKESELIGTPDGVLSAYTFTLMAIFFLQRRHSLPSLQAPEALEAARHGLGLGKAVEERFWQQGRQRDVAFVHALWQAESRSDACGELLHEFFAFFASFDFARQAVSIRLGRDVPREELEQVGLGGQWLIEDPFEVERNLAVTTTRYGRDRILEALLRGVAMTSMGFSSFARLFGSREKRHLLKIRYGGNHSHRTSVLQCMTESVRIANFPVTHELVAEFAQEESLDKAAATAGQYLRSLPGFRCDVISGARLQEMFLDSGEFAMGNWQQLCSPGGRF